MPGVQELLETLLAQGKTAVIVTNSLRTQVEPICKQHPVLQQIQHVITREDYALCKPDPQSYQLAIKRYKKEGYAVIGFEDSARVVRSLLCIEAVPICICPNSYSLLTTVQDPRICHYESFLNIPQTGPESKLPR